MCQHQQAVCIFLIDTAKASTRMPVAGAPAQKLITPLLKTIQSATANVVGTVKDSEASSLLLVSLQAVQALQLSTVSKPLVGSLLAALEAFDLEGEQVASQNTEHGARLRVLRAQILLTWTSTCDHDKPALRKMAVSALATAQEYAYCPHTLESVYKMLEVAAVAEKELLKSKHTAELLPVLSEQLTSSSGSLRTASLGLLVALNKQGSPDHKLLQLCHEVESSPKKVEQGRYMTSRLRDVGHGMLKVSLLPAHLLCLVFLL